MACGNNYYVYKHSTPNNKVYIGITKQNPNRRWRNGHGYKDSHLFFNAIIKYGWLNITHEILKEGLSFEDACKTEELTHSKNPLTRKRAIFAQNAKKWNKGRKKKK